MNFSRGWLIDSLSTVARFLAWLGQGDLTVMEREREQKFTHRSKQFACGCISKTLVDCFVRNPARWWLIYTHWACHKLRLEDLLQVKCRATKKVTVRGRVCRHVHQPQKSTHGHEAEP